MRIHHLTLLSFLFFYFQTPMASDFETVHLWDARVTIGEMLVLGESKYGERRVIPITGGSFKGPNISGEILPFGEDWQLLRPDGDLELYARYMLKTDDGVLIHVINRVLMHPDENGNHFHDNIRSVIDLEAPIDSSYDYLNHAIILGKLTIPEIKDGEEPYAIVHVYQVL